MLMDIINNRISSDFQVKFIDKFDPDDPDYCRQLLRPVEIKEDVNLMSQRRRVSLTLQSDSFRKELEDIVSAYYKSFESTGLNTSLLSLHNLTDLLGSAPGKRPSNAGFVHGSQSGVIPINDIRGTEARLYSRRERILRCKLASIYRLIDLFCWDTSIYNHTTVRLNRHDEHFLICPFGLLCHEVTASSLIKIDSQCQVLDPGSTVLGLDHSSWSLHSAVHVARPNIKCIIHIGTPATIAVSCMKNGLMPISHEAIILGEVAYYNANSAQESETDNSNSFIQYDLSTRCSAIRQVLGPSINVLIMRSAGLLALGETVEEAWHYASNAVAACETQLRLASLGLDHLVLPAQNVRQRAYMAWRTSDLGGVSGPDAALSIRVAQSRSLPANSGEIKDGYLSDSSISPTVTRLWRLGELEFEALMRHLDNAGYRTGHLYRHEALSSPQRSRRTLDRSGACSPGAQHYEDVEIPPFTSSAATALSQFYEDGAFSGDESIPPKPGTLRKQWSDQPWFNTPNNYVKEVSTLPGHQSSSHWVSSREATLRSEIYAGSRLPPPTPFRPLTAAAVPQGTTGGLSSTPSHIMVCNRFAPQGTDPKEYKEQQKKVKAKYYHDTNTSGPQSRLLDGLTWEEAKRIRDDALSRSLGPGAVSGQISDFHPTVAAASKAILQRDIRDAAIVYDAVYTQQNPFGKVTDEDLEAYKLEIEIKNHPDLYAELQQQKSPEVMDSIKSDEDGPVQVSAGLCLSRPIDATVPMCSLLMPESQSNQLQQSGKLASSDEDLKLSPPPTTIISETSELEESQEAEKTKKKKRRFKIPSFGRKQKPKAKQEK